jgi:hypothetical protein
VQTVTPTSELVAQLADMTATGGSLTGLSMGLFTNTVGPARNLTIAALGEVTTGAFPGYARIAQTWGAPWTDPAGNAHLSGSRCQFQPTSAPASTVTVTGFFLADTSTGLELKFVYIFPTPVSVTLVTDAVVVEADYVNNIA